MADVAAHGLEEVIYRTSADWKRQNVLRADGYGEMMEVLYNQPRHKTTTAMFSNKGLLFLEMRGIFLFKQLENKNAWIYCMSV